MYSRRREWQEANLSKESSSSRDERTNKAAGAVDCLTYRRNRAKALFRSGSRGSIRSSISAARGQRREVDAQILQLGVKVRRYKPFIYI